MSHENLGYSPYVMVGNRADAGDFQLSVKYFLSRDRHVSPPRILGLHSSSLCWLELRYHGSEPLTRSRSQIMCDPEILMTEMSSVFHHDLSGRGGCNPPHTNASRQRKWKSLMTLFRNALSDPVRDALASLDPAPTLDAMVTKAIRIDNRVREREREKQEVKALEGKGNWSFSYFSPKKDKRANFVLHTFSDQEEPMQLGTSNLTRDSKNRNYPKRRNKGEYWGGDVAQEVELSSGSRRVAGSIPPWACRSVPEQDT